MTVQLKQHAVILALIMLVLASVRTVHAQQQSIPQLIEKGNRSYAAGSFADAEKWYIQALDDGATNGFMEVRLNLGNALLQQQKYAEALRQFNELAAANLSAPIRAAAFYNAGNTFLIQKNYAGAMEAYKQSLRLNPKDEDARYNFSLAVALANAQQGMTRPSAPPGPEMERKLPQQTLDPEKLRRMMEELQAAENKTMQNRAGNLPSITAKEKDW